MQYVILVFGILCLIYYYCIISLLGVRKDFSLLWLLGGLACIIYFILIRFKAVRDFLDRIPKAIPLIMALIVLVFGLIFVLFVGMTVSGSRGSAPDGADYCIVLGAKTRSDHIPLTLYYRLERALEYHKNNPETVFVVSGGQGADEDATESSVMKSFLLEHGVPEDRIICEDRSRNTDENLDFSYELIRKDCGDREASVIICTTNFHIFRALCLARAKELPVKGGLAAKGKAILGFHYTARECVGLAKELVVGNIKIKDLKS